MHIDQDLNDNDLKIKPPEGLSGQELKKWKYQRYMRDYLACVQSVDDNVGRFLDWLDKNGLAENTIDIHVRSGLLPRRALLRQAVYVRRIAANAVPDAVAREDPAGSVSKGMILNVDFAPTLLDAAGAPTPADMQGLSFLPLLEGRKRSVGTRRCITATITRAITTSRPLRRSHHQLQADLLQQTRSVGAIRPAQGP